MSSKTEQVMKLVMDIVDSVPPHPKSETKEDYTQDECEEIFELASRASYISMTYDLIEESLAFIENFKYKGTE